MNDDTPSVPDLSSLRGPFIPIFVLGLSYLIFVAWQVSNLSGQRQAMEAESAREDQIVMQSHDAQAALQRLASDLLDVAQTDDTAKAIVEKYGIQRNPPPPSPLK